VLKKSAFVVATVATGLLVSSPMAFAQDAPTVSNTCSSSQSAGTFTQTLVGGSSLLGVGGAVTGVITPATVQTQAANCTNVNFSDLVDNNSNNTTVNRTRNVIQNSFNRFRFRN
jgi:hypothetical protein